MILYFRFICLFVVAVFYFLFILALCVGFLFLTFYMLEILFCCFRFRRFHFYRFICVVFVFVFCSLARLCMCSKFCRGWAKQMCLVALISLILARPSNSATVSSCGSVKFCMFSIVAPDGLNIYAPSHWAF